MFAGGRGLGILGLNFAAGFAGVLLVCYCIAEHVGTSLELLSDPVCDMMTGVSGYAVLF